MPKDIEIVFKDEESGDSEKNKISKTEIEESEEIKISDSNILSLQF